MMDMWLTVVSCCHRGQAISHKVRLWVIVRVAEYVSHGTKIRYHQPAPSNETVVSERSAVFRFPGCYEVVVLHVVHFLEVAQEEGRRRRPSESSKRRDILSYDQRDESRGSESKENECREDNEECVKRDETIEH